MIIIKNQTIHELIVNVEKSTFTVNPPLDIHQGDTCSHVMLIRLCNNSGFISLDEDIKYKLFYYLTKDKTLIETEAVNVVNYYRGILSTIVSNKVVEKFGNYTCYLRGYLDEEIVSTVSFTINIAKTHDYIAPIDEVVITKEFYDELKKHINNKEIHLSEADRDFLDTFNDQIEELTQVIDRDQRIKDYFSSDITPFISIPEGLLNLTGDMIFTDKDGNEHIINSPASINHKVVNDKHFISIVSNNDIIIYKEDSEEYQYNSLSDMQVKIDIDDELSYESENPVQNKVITAHLLEMIVNSPDKITDNTKIYYNDDESDIVEIYTKQEVDEGFAPKSIIVTDFDKITDDTEIWNDLDDDREVEVYTVENVDELLSEKLDKNQGIENVGKVLTVGSDGITTPQDISNYSVDDETIEVSPEGELRVKNSGIGTEQLADGSVTEDKLSNSVISEIDSKASQSDLDTEISNRQNADEELSTQIGSVASDLSEEVTNRENADIGLSDDISSVANDLSDEITNRGNADNDLQEQIDAITVSSDVIDVLGTHAQLVAYDTSHVKPNDIIKVLQDETEGYATTYYRWVVMADTNYQISYNSSTEKYEITFTIVPTDSDVIVLTYKNDNNEDVTDTFTGDGTTTTFELSDIYNGNAVVHYWDYVGKEGPYYTKSESDNRFVKINQTSTNSGKILGINNSGNVTPVDFDYNDLLNKPRSKYIATTANVNFTDIADNNVYDIGNNFKLVKLSSGTVVNSIDVHTGDILSVTPYDSTDGYSIISLFCNQGLYNFQTNITDWSLGFCINAEQLIDYVPTVKLPTSGVIGQTPTCDVTSLPDGIYYNLESAKLVGWDNSEELLIPIYTKVTKITSGVNTRVVVDNTFYIDYDLTTAQDLYIPYQQSVNDAGKIFNVSNAGKAQLSTKSELGIQDSLTVGQGIEIDTNNNNTISSYMEVVII